MPREACSPDPVPAALDRGKNTKGWDRGEDAGEPDDTEEREEHHRNWGGPGRGGGAKPKAPAAYLRKTIGTAQRTLALLREANDMPYAERLALFQQIDALQEVADEFMCAAPDYPGANESS